MTKAKAFDKAWKLSTKGDFSLYDEIVHPDYESINLGVRVDREVSKAVLQDIGTHGRLGPFRVIYENEDFVCLHRYSRLTNEEVFFTLMTAVKYKDQKVINQ
jgi:c-di-GMP-related signal transduction protein